MQKVKLAEKILKIKDVLPTVEKDLSSRGCLPRYPLTSLPDFNRKIWGMCEGLTVIGARTSQGKSSVSLQFAYDLACQNVPTIFLSLTRSAIFLTMFSLFTA